MKIEEKHCFSTKYFTSIKSKQSRHLGRSVDQIRNPSPIKSSGQIHIEQCLVYSMVKLTEFSKVK